MAWDSADRRSRLLLGLLAVVHLLIISRQVDTGGGVSLFEKTALAGLHPFQLVVSRTADGLSETWHGFVDLRGVRQDNRRLQAENDALRAELRRHEVRAEESERLRALLDLRERLPAGGVAAEVVARGALPSRSRVTGVVSGQVGATDQLPWLALKYVPARSDVLAGDRVVTSGLDRIYPKGLLVGHVAQVGAGSGLFQDITVTPAAPFERLEAVVLLPPTPPEPLEQEEPR